MLDPDIQILQNAASQARAFASAKNSAWRLCLAHAVLYLARACKSRINDEFQAVVTLGRLAGDKREIPDVALDKHTLRGKMQNRGMEHFLKEGCKLENEDPANNTYRERAENLWMRLDKDKDLAQKYSDEGNRVRPNRETDPDE
jgi:replication-associated recombination protein RarA